MHVIMSGLLYDVKYSCMSAVPSCPSLSQSCTDVSHSFSLIV